MPAATEPRQMVQLRLREGSVRRVDELAEQQELSRSAMLRVLFVLGLRAWDEGKRP